MDSSFLKTVPMSW